MVLGSGAGGRVPFAPLWARDRSYFLPLGRKVQIFGLLWPVKCGCNSCVSLTGQRCHFLHLLSLSEPARKAGWSLSPLGGGVLSDCDKQRLWQHCA